MSRDIPLNLLIREAEAQARDRTFRDKDAPTCTVWIGERNGKPCVYVRSDAEGQPEGATLHTVWTRGMLARLEPRP